MHRNFYHFLLFLLITISLYPGCSDTDMQTDVTEEPDRVDLHSYATPDAAKTDSLHLELSIDFDKSTVLGVARHFIQKMPSADSFIADTKDLKIDSVLVDGKIVNFEIGANDPILGRPLTIPIEKETKEIAIHYSTSPDAPAFLWVPASQTMDKVAPFLFTQGQAILTRSWIPCQDSPGIRFPYSARITVPKGMMALMSASNPDTISVDGIYHFRMEQPVPAYLIALAAGHLEFAPMGDRTGVYAEPSMLEACKYEFAEMEKMLIAAEKLYGPYRWGRYDLLVLPPSFPFGGMENPRLTFATPTIIAGDRSLTSLIAHELAHSWSGNLVTNETWNDFWLNEGFTTYFERRIMEALYGKDYAEMLAELGYQDLLFDLQDLGDNSDDTKLKLDLTGRDPDDGMTDIAYEKGALFLTALELSIGREKLDQFLTSYFNQFAFQTMNTESFISHLETTFPELDELGLHVNEWIYSPGLPKGHPVVRSERFANIQDLLTRYIEDGTLPQTSQTAKWSTHEWLHFLRGLPIHNTEDKLASLGQKFDLDKSNNAEIVAIWLEKNIQAGRTNEVWEQLEDFLIKVGRRKFLMPLYRALAEHDQLQLAQNIFDKAGKNYHSVSYHSVDHLLNPNR